MARLAGQAGVAERRLGREGRPGGLSLEIGSTCFTMSLLLMQSGHRIALMGGPGRLRSSVQRLVDFLAVPAAFSVSSRARSPIAVVAPSTLWASSRWAFRSWAAKSNTES